VDASREKLPVLLLFLLLCVLLAACSGGWEKTEKPKQDLHMTGPTSCETEQRPFQAGISYPQWSVTGYGDEHWSKSLALLKAQTGACWIQMPILLTQETLISTDVFQDTNAPALYSYAEGVRAAHAQGLRVFTTFLLTVKRDRSDWAGDIYFQRKQDIGRWFESYWQAIQPYVQVAQEEKVEQLALGTELEWLAAHAPAQLWTQLLGRARALYTGSLVYDMNWTGLQEEPPAWMKDPALTTIGVSAYMPILLEPRPIPRSHLTLVWKQREGAALDTFARRLGKPVLISEIGYRRHSDALADPWRVHSKAPLDPALQASACEAALQYARSNPRIRGVFFWAWDEVGAMSLRDQPAAIVLRNWFTSPPTTPESESEGPFRLAGCRAAKQRCQPGDVQRPSNGSPTGEG
jgi:hypothetical protein